MSRRNHAERMADFEKQFRAGTKLAVLHALCEYVCSHPEKPVPDWVKDEFAKALYEVTSARVASFDDVFGKTLPKGKHLRARRSRLELREKVWRECMERRADGAGISGDLFGAVAEKLKIPQRQVSEMFYELKRAGRPVVERGRRFMGSPIFTPKN